MRAELLEFDPTTLRGSESTLALDPVEATLLAPDHPFLDHGDWRAFAVLHDGTLAARIVASIDARQRHSTRTVGCIGFVNIAGDAGRPGDTPVAANQVMAAALGWLRGRDANVIRCPVQFSTWYGHRAITESFPDDGGRPHFALEPRGSHALVELLRSSGFSPAHRAVSYEVASDAVFASAGASLSRLRRAGLRDRPLRESVLEDELRLLHQLSIEIFRDSWAFSEISLDEFCSLYRPLSRLADPELVRILETQHGEALGFAFAMPDQRTADGASAIVVKTLGLLPDETRRHPGAGPGLTALVHRAAHDRGYRGAVHALMAEGSMAHRLSVKWGTQIRSYATFDRAGT